MWPLHGLNQFRIQHILPVLNQHFDIRNDDLPLAGLSVLDIGCGGGLLSEAMYKLGATVHGVDAAEQNIRIARKHAKAQALNIHYMHGEAGQLIDSGNSYDIVMNMEVVEHVADSKLFLQEAQARMR